MPVIKSAKKKLRQDIKREKVNNLLRKKYKDSLKAANKLKTGDSVKSAVKLVDKAVGKGLIHKNKAARIKSSLSKLAKMPVRKAVATKKNIKKASPPKKKK